MNKKILILMVLGLFMFSFTSAALTDNILSYHKLDEENGTIIDSTPNGNDCNTFNGALQNQTGKINKSIDFDGTDDIVICGDYLNGDTNLTINIWANTVNGKEQDLVKQGSTILLRKDSNNSYKMFVYGANEFVISNSTSTASTWEMITTTLDTSTKTQKIYINGVLKGVNVWSGTRTTGPKFVTFGADVSEVDNSSTFQETDGNLDEILISEDVKTGAEILQLYNSGAGLTYPFIISGSNPIVNLLTPSDNSKQITSTINFTTNITVNEDFNHTNQTLFIWNENNSLFYTETKTEDYDLTISPNWSASGFELGMDYTWNVLAFGNDSSNNYANNNFTFTASVFSEDNVVFENSVLETSNKQFNLTINSTGVDEISSIFWYNGSSYPAVTIDLGSGNYKAIRSIDIPLQNSSGNKSFHWQFDFILTNSNSLQQNSTTYSQEVNETFFTLCNATFTTPFVNFTSRDAENPFPIINISFKSAWQWFVNGGTGSVSRNMSYEDVNENVSNFQFCGSPNATFTTNVDIEIDADGFAQNYYYLVNSSLSNDTENINLYLLNDTLATPTTLLVRDKFQNLIEGMLIHVQLYDVGTDTFYTIGMARTNENGEDNFYLNWFDSLYKFILIQDGSTVLSTNVTKVFETPKIFELPDVTTYSFDKFDDFEFTLSFDELINTFSLTYIKPSGEVEEGCLRVIKRTSLNDTEICLTCSSSASATLFCDISSAGNGTFIAAFYATGSWFLIDWVDEVIGESFAQGINDLLNQDDAAFYTILLIGIVLSMFLFNPILGIIGALLGLLAAGALGFTVLTYGLYLGIVIIGGVIIWILKR